MSGVRLIICETTSKWAVALRRAVWPTMPLQLSETRSLSDCWNEATACPCSVVVLEATPGNLGQLARALSKYRTRLRRVCVLVVGSRTMSPVRGLALEFGAVYAVFSLRDVAALVRIAHRHGRRCADLATEEATAWQRLPWGTPRSESVERKIGLADWLADRP